MPIRVEYMDQLVFKTVTELHPDLLTPDELALKLANDPDLPVDGHIRETITHLKRSGVLRDHGGLVVPTHAAACTAALLLSDPDPHPDDICRPQLHTCRPDPS
jgi:hypothetical protein